MWRTIRVTAGVTLIALGVIGMLLPVLPGIPLLIAGMALVAPDHPAIRRLRERLKRWRQGRRASR
jgi:uncharacterized membrane protein YbaN (DUF454 family)